MADIEGEFSEDLLEKEVEVEGKKLTKVVLEFEDGTIQVLEGDKAQGWNEALKSAAVMEFVHGRELPDFGWIKISREQVREMFN